MRDCGCVKGVRQRRVVGAQHGRVECTVPVLGARGVVKEAVGPETLWDSSRRRRRRRRFKLVCKRIVVAVLQV